MDGGNRVPNHFRVKHLSVSSRPCGHDRYGKHGSCKLSRTEPTAELPVTALSILRLGQPLWTTIIQPSLARQPGPAIPLY
jgi:hypothetical protein